MGGAQDKLDDVSRCRIGEGMSAILEEGSAVQSNLIEPTGKDSDEAEAGSFGLQPESNNRRATEGGTESVYTSKSGLNPSESSSSIGAASTCTRTSDAGGSSCATGGHLGAAAVFATTVM